MRKISAFIAAGVSLLALAPATVLAQAAPAAAASEDDEDIVVTGTLIRGIDVPTGTQPISVDADTITDKAAGSTNELLSLVPQISNTFNGRFEGDPRGIAAGTSITKPNLRGLPGFNSSSGGTTLVLMDGFRFAPVGVNQSANDVDIIPAAILSGIQVVAGGGSSLYGADAVSGVINFTTLRKFEGIKVDANYGFGTTIKGHKQWDAQLTAGTSWETGNAYISGGYSHRSLVLNNETDWATGEVYNATGTTSRFVSTQCNTPQQTESRWGRFGPGAAQFTNNPGFAGAGPSFSLGSGCDGVGPSAYSPEQRRYNVFAAVTNDFSDSISMRVTGYYTKRDTEVGIFARGFTSRGSGIASAAQLTQAFPAALAISPGQIFAVPEGVGFSFAPNAAYVNTPNTVGFTTWGVTPELTVKVGSNWQVKATAHFGRSSNYSSFPGTDTVKAQNYITGATGVAAGQLNPLNVAAASAAVIQDITNFTTAQDTKQQLFVGRVVADGTVFSLGDRDVKLAVGLEYQTNKAGIRLNAGTFGSLDALPFQNYSRNAKSAFAEINVPITSFLDVTGSLRWDDYSDFGSTTNPNIGATLKPADWLKIYGHWNKSFNAPTAVDGLGIANGRFACGIYAVNGTAAQRPNNPLLRDNGQGTCALILDGVKAGVTPQTGESWAFGFEITPTTGMKFGAEFYSIDFTNLIGAVDPTNLNTYITNPELYIYNRQFTGVVGNSTNVGTPTLTYAGILAQVANGASLAAQQMGSNVALVVDRRASNFGAAQLEGVDFKFSYTTETDLGRVSVGLNSNYKTRTITNFGVLTNETLITPRVTSSLNFGLSKGGFSSRLTVNYSGKFLDSGTTINGISRPPVASFTTMNLSLGYEFDESAGALGGTSLRLTIDNLNNEKPQRIQRTQANVQTYQNWTIGRVIKLGISKKF